MGINTNICVGHASKDRSGYMSIDGHLKVTQLVGDCSSYNVGNVVCCRREVAEALVAELLWQVNGVNVTSPPGSCLKILLTNNITFKEHVFYKELSQYAYRRKIIKVPGWLGSNSFCYFILMFERNMLRWKKIPDENGNFRSQVSGCIDDNEASGWYTIRKFKEVAKEWNVIL